MAIVEISHDDRAEAVAVLGYNSDRTSAIRWWKPKDGPAVLQAEWISGDTGQRIWINVPTIAEIPE